jgi:hypothetical protein
MENNKPIQLTEQDLHMLVEDAVRNILKENDMEEGWFGDKWNQTKTAANTMFQGNQGAGLKQKFNNARKNWNTQGQLNGLNNLKQQLEQFIDSGQLNPQMTIAQLVGGKYNGNKFCRMTGMIGNRQSQIARNGGQYN